MSDKTNLFGNSDKILDDASKENKERVNILGQKEAENALMAELGIQKDVYRERQALKSGTRKETEEQERKERMDKYNKMLEEFKQEEEKRIIYEEEYKKLKEQASKYNVTEEMKETLERQRIIVTANKNNVHPWFLGYKDSVVDIDFYNPEGLHPHIYGILMGGIKFPGSPAHYKDDPRLKYPAIKRNQNANDSRVLEEIMSTPEGKNYLKVNFIQEISNCKIANSDMTLKDSRGNYVLVKNSGERVIQIIGEEYTYDDCLDMEGLNVDSMYEGDIVNGLYLKVQEYVTEGTEVVITRESDYKKIISRFNSMSTKDKGLQGLRIMLEDNRLFLRKKKTIDEDGMVRKVLSCDACGKGVSVTRADECIVCGTIMCERCSNEEYYICVKCGETVQAIE